ncbi:ParB/RepB/Spo0J family partition protein [Promicromonospora vindobonensis]|uniref:ParB/RepB/Spo0J family partition protein n=1 Tax=Promicromonospora vindobonensis TaxID=195748 RepID=A0ABW5W1I2_9MICO
MSHNTIEKATEFANLDPKTLALEVNVRSEAGLTPEFIASVHEHGVLVPILVQRTDDGQMLVRAGQRRTLAAIEAGRETIPARIVNGDGDEARRIIEQVVENDQRANLRDKDRAAGFQQLALLGVPAATIAKKTGHTKETVNTALTVGKSKFAVAAQGKYDLTLDQAATIAEFDALGDREAVKALTATAVKEPGQFAHTAQRLRDEHERAAKKAVVVASLTDACVRVIPVPTHDDKTVKVLGDLTDADGTVLSVESHAGCPGHAAYVRPSYGPEVYTAVFVCDAWKANKHLTLRVTSSGQPMDAEATAKAKAERAEVIANNTDWRSGETVRRQWLAEFAQRKNAPKDAAAFISTALVTEASAIEKTALSGHALAAEWLGVGGTFGGRDKVRDLIAKASPARAQQIGLVVVLAAIEDRTGVQTWRKAGREAAYLGALESWGYTLSPVEQIARGPKHEPAAPSVPAKANTTARAKFDNAKPAPKAAPKPVTKETTTA